MFPGTFAFDAVSATCAGDGIEPTRVFELLASLVDKSLVVVEAADETTRYRLLETVREYALEKLRESGEYPAIAHRHATAYVALAEEIDRLWYTEADHDWFPRLERELDNFRRSARLHKAAARRIDVLAPRRGARAHVVLAAAGRRRASDPRRRPNSSIQRPTPPTVARLAIAEAELHESRVQFRSAREAAERAKVRFTDLGDELGYARALHLTGASLVGIGSLEEGERLLAESLTIARALDAPRLVAMALGDIGGARNRRGDADGARDAYAEALAYHRSHGFERQAASIAGNLAEVEFGGGQTEAALRYARSTLDGHLALGNQRAVAIDLFNMAAYLIALDRFEEARTAAVESLATSREFGARMFVAVTLQHLAAIMALDPAVDDDQRAAAGSGRSVCLVSSTNGLRSSAACASTPSAKNTSASTAVLRASLGDEECERLAARGRGWSEDRAVAEATEP